MFKINEDKSIYLTRGDIANITVGANDTDGNAHTFSVGDVVRLKVFKRKDCANVVLQKDVVVKEECQTVDILIGRSDTKIGDIINTPTKYWYEVELNPDTTPQTIIGYDEEGEKLFVLYPEGGDL